MGLENREQRLKKFEKAPIKTPQQQTEALQKAQAEIGGLTNERQALLKQQQSALLGYQQQLGALQNQANSLSTTPPLQQSQVNVAQQTKMMNAQTQAILQKYGVNPRKPQVGENKIVQQKPIIKTTVSGKGTTNIKTENKAIYNTKTTNNIQVVQPQGNPQINIQRPTIQVSQPAIQLRNKISQQIQSQNQQYERSKKSFLRTDISLRKGADMMMRKIDAASKRFAENMNPQKLAESSINSTKVLMWLAIAYIGSKLIGPISRRIDKLYYWFTGEPPEGEEGKSNKYNEHLSFFDRLKALVDTKKDDSLASKIINFFKDGFKDIKSYLELVFQDRAKAIASVKGLQEREGWFDGSVGGLKYFPAYIADIFTALVGGTAGQAKAETRKQTKEIEEKAKEQLLNNKDIPSGGIVGDKAARNQYMLQLTEGGVAQNATKTYGVSHNTGTYSIAMIQQQHDLVRKNASNPLGNGSSIVTTEYAYALGGEKVNIFNDERTKKYAKRVRLKSFDLLSFKLLQLSEKDYKGILSNLSKFISSSSVPNQIMSFLKIFWQSKDEDKKEKTRKIYEDLYKKIKKYFEKKVDYDAGWQKEVKTTGEQGIFYIEYEIYYFPENEEEEIKKYIENIIKEEIDKHKDILNNKLLNFVNFTKTTKEVAKIDKELFNVIKDIYGIKEYNTADPMADEYFKSMANSNYREHAGITDEQGLTMRYNNSSQKTYTDEEELEKARAPIKAVWDLEKENEKRKMVREQEYSPLYRSFMNTVKGVSSKVNDAVVNLRTDDNIEKSAPAINNVVEYLSKSLGIPKDAAIGIVSNLWAESKLNPIAIGDNRSSLGIAQWHYKKGIQQVIQNIEDITGIKLKTEEDGNLLRVDTEDQSWQKLKEFTQNDENHQKLLLNQLDLIVKHLKEAKSSSDYGKLYDQLKRTYNPISAEEASQLFTELFEKPDEERLPGFIKERRDYASQIKRYLNHNYNTENQQTNEDWWKTSEGDSTELAEKFSSQVAEYTAAVASNNINTEPPQVVQIEDNKPKEESTPKVTSTNPVHNVANMFNNQTNNNLSIVNTTIESDYNAISGI